MNLKTASLTLVLAILLPLTAAHGGTITLVGIDGTQVTTDGNALKLQGTYSLENIGDEAIQNVTVSVQVGSWIWAGTPVTLRVKEKKEWSASETIPVEQLSCEQDGLCAGLDLPAKGLFPKMIRRHYEDVNGYQYGYLDVYTQQVGSLTPTDTGMIFNAPLTGKLTVSGSSGRFKGRLDVFNSAAAPREVAVSVLTSKQIKLNTVPQKLTIGSQETAKVVFDLENFSARPQSNNPVFAVLQWKEGAARATVVSRAEIFVTTPSYSGLLIGGCIAFAVLSLLVLIVLSRRAKTSAS